MGRPPEPVPQDIAEKILDGLYDGRALAAICRGEGMPKPRTVSDWKAKDPEFAAAYARAREEGAALRFDRAGQIVKKATPETVHVAKLQAEHEYKAAACFCPSVFGTKQHLEHSGAIDIGLSDRVKRARERIASRN